MQETLTKQRVQVEPSHPRFRWREEVLRGVVTILFGLLIPFTLTIFIAVLGIYMVLDGALEMITTGRCETPRTFLKYPIGIVSIALGVISLVTPWAILFLIVVVISTRMIFRGARVIIAARRSRHIYEGFTWLFGIVLMLVGLALFSNALRSVLDLPPTTRRAVIFVRHAAAIGLGHVGWAFEWNNGWFNAGAVENEQEKAFAMPREMGFWSAHTLDPIGTMQKQPGTYDEYKVFYVTQPLPKDAWRTVVWESQHPYTVVRHNCSDVVYDILRAYGTSVFLDPVEEPVPNDWYEALPGRSYLMVEHPSIPLHLHQMSKRQLATRETLLAIPERVLGTAPPWRVNGWRAWQELSGTWDKMLRDMRTLFVSSAGLVARRRDQWRQGRPHAH